MDQNIIKSKSSTHISKINNPNKYYQNISSINSQIDSKNGNTPLILSLISNDMKSFTELISQGALINIPNYLGETPLHIAVQKNNLEAVLILINSDKNLDINSQNKKGETPLHLAFKKTEKKIIEILINKGAEINIKNNLGQTPVHNACINKFNDEKILKLLKKNNADIFNIKDKYNMTGFDYVKNSNDVKYQNLIMKIFSEIKYSNNDFKYVQTWNETKLTNILNEIRNNTYNSNNNKKINDKIYLDKLNSISIMNNMNNSQKNENKYNYEKIIENNKKKNELTDDEKKSSINNRIYTHGRAMLCSDLNSNNIQIKELNSSDYDNYNDNDSNNKSKKSLSDFLAEEVNNLDINSYKINKNNYIGINNIILDNKENYNNINKNISRIYSQKSDNSILSKIIENDEKSESSKMNSHIPFSHSSSRINTYKSEKSNLSQNSLNRNSLSISNNRKIVKSIINDTVKKIIVKSISSSEGDNISNLNILSKDSERNFSSKNNEIINKINIEDNNGNFYENGKTSFIRYKSKNLEKSNSNDIINILTNKENKSINISNINEEINIITNSNTTDQMNKTNKTNEFIQDNNTNRNKTIILQNTIKNFPSSNTDKQIHESPLNLKFNDININNNMFLNSETSHIFSELNPNTNTNNYNNVSLSYSKNLQSFEKSKTKSRINSNENFDKKNNININSNNSFYGSNYSKRRISNGNQCSNNKSIKNEMNTSTGIKKSKSFMDSTSMKKNTCNRSIYNKFELENMNLQKNENSNNNSNLQDNINKDRIYKKHHRQLSYHINYKSGLNYNKDKEFKKSNTKEIIGNINALQKSNKNDIIYLNKNSLGNYSSSKKDKEKDKDKDKDKENMDKSKEKESILGNINKSIKSLASTNNQNNTVTHNIYANSITTSNNIMNDSNIIQNININKVNNQNHNNKFLSGNTSSNTAFSTLHKQKQNMSHRQSKFNNNNNDNKKNIPNKKNHIKSNDEEIIYNDYLDEEDEEDYKYEIKNIKTDVLLRLREFLLSCDLLCYYNLFIEKKMYKIDSYINDLQEGISSLNYDHFEKIGIKKPGHIFRILIKLEIDAGIIDNNLYNYIIEKINYHSYTTTTLALTSSINDINCCGINFCSNQCKYPNRNSRRNINYNFNDLSSFLRSNNLSKFQGNFIYNGFDKIEFIIIQLFSKYSFDHKILNNYLHVYINKDKIKILKKLYSIKINIAKELGIDIDIDEIDKIIYNKKKIKNEKKNIFEISYDNKNSIRKNITYIKGMDNSYLNSINHDNKENYNNINMSNSEKNNKDQNQNQNNCNIF